MNRDRSRTEARRTAIALLIFAAVACSAGIGYLASDDYVQAIGALVALFGAALFIYRPFIGVLLLVATIPVENLAMATEEVTIARLLGMGVVAGWVAHKIIRRESFAPLLRSGLLIIGGAFILMIALSVLWARDPALAMGGTKQGIRLLGMGVLLLDVLDSWERLERVVQVLVLMGLVAALVTVEQYFWGGARRAGGQVAGGINTTATLLLTCLPLAFYLFRSRSRIWWRLVGAAFFVASVIAIVVTFSRMNLLLLPPLLLLLYWDTLRGRRGTGWIVVLTSVGVLVGASAVPWDRVTDRMETVVPYLEGAVEGDAQESDRGYHLRVGLAIARDHPFVGVGYNNYGYEFLHNYQYTVEGGNRLYGTIRSPHSSHIGIVADLGIIGLAIWLALLAVAAFKGLQAWRRTRRESSRFSDRHFLVQGLLYAFLLQAVPYGLYLPVQQQKIFWALLPTVFVLERLSRRQDSARTVVQSDAVSAGERHRRPGVARGYA